MTSDEDNDAGGLFKQAAKMNIKLNGEARELPDGTTIEALLLFLDIKPIGIAIDINREIVPKRLFSSTVLKEGDAVEVVRMVGGG